ncbi:MAG: TraR/DksA family transcriptional regulator [Holophagales bacterium]|nr:TraR/DksA family transcriptional regulator [Holophagales bacterium]
MSDLTAEQLEAFHQRLAAAKVSIQELLGQGAKEKPVEASGPTIGRLSRMDAIQLRAMSQMSRSQLRIRLQQVEASLTDLERGRYGLCRRCKEPIRLERLEALPEAPFCVECQEGFEV